jgi:cephalosporin hydroxylase
MSTLQDQARSLVRALAPNLLQRVQLRKTARRLSTRCDSAATLTELIHEVETSGKFRAHQKLSEIRRFLEIVRDLNPQTICEIGAAQGGTLCLFSRVAARDARLLSIDINFSPLQRAVFPALIRRGQNAMCLMADSHDPETLVRVRKWLRGRLIDVLFIDGDHSHAGVACDFEMFSPLVRPGGIIGFHDIVPDFKTRFGIQTVSDVGQVPAFWNELKKAGHRTQELIDDPQQDGFGIGVLHWSDSATLKE